MRSISEVLSGNNLFANVRNFSGGVEVKFMTYLNNGRDSGYYK